MKHVYFVIGFLLWSNNSFGMEPLEPSTVNQQTGLFDLLSKDITKLVFESLQPKEINRLRRSCKKWSTLFSFHNPSLEFVLLNPHISQKDLESIFITAVYDGKDEMVKALLELKRIDNNYFYGIPTLSVGVFPYCVAPEKEILQNFNQEIARRHWKSLRGEGIDCYIPEQILMACISRNRDRIKESSKKIKKINKTEFSFCWYVLIENKDNISLKAVFKNIEISEDMKQMGNQLIEHAYTNCNSVAVKILLNHGCYDDLNKITIENIPKFIPIKGSINQEDFTRSLQVGTLLDRILRTGFDPSLDAWDHPSRRKIYNLLRNKGANTAEELFEAELIKKKEINEGKNKETTHQKCCMQ
jgi:hypothetical protein